VRSSETTPAPRVEIKPRNTDTEALFLGFLGVLIFSFTLPMTRLAAPEMGGLFVGLARALIGAILAGALLLFRRERFPERKYWRGIATVSLGCVVGFSSLTGLALQSVPSLHGVVIVGLLPAATALMGVLLTRERPKLAFWGWNLAGVCAIVTFAWLEGGGRLQPADGLLLLAVILAGLGYAEGARVARALEGWRTISWALVFAAPFLSVPVLLLASHGIHADAPAWLGFAYVSVFSVFLGFFPWYRGLALGGVTRVAPIQMIQPMLSLIWSALILHEHLSARVVIFGVLITGIAWFTRQAAQARKVAVVANPSP